MQNDIKIGTLEIKMKKYPVWPRLHPLLHSRPDGEEYGEFRLLGHIIGIADPIHPDLWLVQKTKKPRTALDAAKVMLDQKFNQIHNEEKVLRRLMEALRNIVRGNE